MNKEAFFEEISWNIASRGFHITIVQQSTVPRYAYTIGLLPSWGFELVLAGGYFYMRDEIVQIFNMVSEQIKQGIALDGLSISCGKHGAFTIRKAHTSWIKPMLLGVFDYYGRDEVTAYQLIPDADHFTLEIPVMTQENQMEADAVWKWLECAWSLPVSPQSNVVTHLDVLKGEPVTEVMRWSDDEWEAFAGPGPDVPKSEIRIVPIATLLGIEPSLTPILELALEKGVWRESQDEAWNDWG